VAIVRMVERGEFSEALYYRINVVTLLLDRMPA
jgi:transcriptional regulator of aromatic amino acid metabolism